MRPLVTVLIATAAMAAGLTGAASAGTRARTTRASAVATRTSAKRAATASSAKRHPASPSRRQIAAAVQRAKHSKDLWATVNICDPRRPASLRYVVGIRGQMPALGFSARLTMTVHVGYWSQAEHAFVPDSSPNATRTQALGSEAHGLQQSGAEFKFYPHAGRFDATVTFQWTRGRTILARVQRPTTAHHPSADFGTPPHYTAASCSVK